jgi:hypothetical protein
MSRKKKAELAKLLATIIYSCERDLAIPRGACENIIEAAVDVADRIGGDNMLRCVEIRVMRMRRGGEGE